METTIVVQIGNSDNKLTQGEWSNYVHNIYDKIKSVAKTIHFNGGSSYDVSQQNACFVFEVEYRLYSNLCSELKFIREFFEQDSIVIISGDVEFI